MLRKILELPITLLRKLSEWPARMGRNRRRRSSKEQSQRRASSSSRRKGGVLAAIGKVFTLPLDWIRSGSDSLARAGKTRERSKQKKQAKSSRGPSKAASTAKADRWLTNLGRKLIHPFILFSTWLERFGPKKPKAKHDPKAEKEALKDRVQQIEKKNARAEWWKNSWVGKTVRFIAPPFVFAWTLIKTRDPALLWWMLPLILIVGGLGFVVYQTTFVDARKIAVRYESAVAAAIKAGDLKSANLFQRKLEQLGISTERGIFKRAFALGESGDLEGAAEQMRTIAKPDAPGHAAAHYWLAQKLIDEELKGFPPPENAELALQHIEQLKARIGMYPEVSFIEAVALAKLGRLDEASLAFGESPRQYLEAATAKMEIDLARGDEAAARQVAITVQRHLAQLRVEGMELTEVQYEQDLKSAELLDDAKAAALAVENWFKANPNSDEARLYSGALKLREFDKWLLDPREDTISEFADLIIDVSKSIPEERDDLVRRRLNSINRSRDDATVDQLYEALIQSPDLTGNSLEFFATAVAIKQQWEMADDMFATAAQRDAEHSQTWNNWAYVLDTAFPDRRDEALEYAETATELEPNNADYRETRGKVLLNLQRWEEAAEQLEIAVNGVVNTAPVHLSLATAYEKMGKDRLADLHRRASGQ